MLEVDDGTGKQTNGLFSLFSYVRLQKYLFLEIFYSHTMADRERNHLSYVTAPKNYALSIYDFVILFFTFFHSGDVFFLSLWPL